MEVTLYLAEDIRNEIHGGVSMIGFLPGNVVPIRLPVDPESGRFARRVLTRLAFLLRLVGVPADQQEFELGITLPDGRELPAMKGRFAPPTADGARNIVIHLPTFSPEVPGQHIVNLRVAGQSFATRFWLKALEPAK